MDDTDTFELKQHRSTFIRNVVITGAGAIPALLLLAWSVYGLYMDISRGSAETVPPGIVINVKSDGSIVVDGCTDDLDTCLQRIDEQGNERPGGGLRECLIVPEQGAREEAVNGVVLSCVRGGFSSTVTVRSPRRREL